MRKMFQKMENIYEKFDFRENALIVLALYFVTFFIYSDFKIHSVVGLILLYSYGLLTLIQFVLIDKQNVVQLLKNKIWIPVEVLLIIIGICILNNFYIDNTEIFYILIAFVSVGIGSLSKKIKMKQYQLLRNIFLVASFLVSTLIYMYKFFPNIYRNIVFNFILESSKEYIIRLTNEGYSVSICGDIGYTLLIIIVGILFLCFGIGYEKEYKKKIPLFIYYFTAILISQRRTELIFLIFTLLVVFFILYRKQIIFYIKKYKIFFIIGILGSALAVTIFWGWVTLLPEDYISNSRIVQTFIDLKNGKDISTGRAILYEIAINLFIENPIWGIGWMNFSKYAILSGNTNVRNVHCIYLQVLVECGIILGGILLLVIIQIFVKSFLMAKKDKCKLCAIGIQIYFLVAGLIENTIFTPWFWELYVISIVLLFNMETCKDKNNV